MISRRQFLVASTALVLAACSSDDSDSTPSTSAAGPSTSAPGTTPATTSPVATAASTTVVTPTTAATTSTSAAAATTTVDLATMANAYAAAGPHPVGVTTLTLGTGNLVEVWYPAVDGTTGSESYDVRDFTPAAIRAILTADVPATFTYPAGRDSDVAAGEFPLVLFSHGYSGFRLQSTFLTAHLASWGMIVAAPDHPSRSLTDVLGNTTVGGLAESVQDLLGSLDLVVGSARFDQHVDPTRVAAVGHSAGGGTVVAAAADDRISGYVSMASGLLGRSVDDTSTTAPPASLPAKPSFFLAGALDGIASPVDVTRPAFEAAPSPSLLWIIDGVGHNGFDDFCTFGNGTGIIGIAEASGLGAFLDASPQLRALGQDGCLPPAVPVATTFPIIDHAVTAWLRHLFSVDAEAIGLDADVGTSYAQSVTIEQH